jgi:membrane-bound serine protease (ClpP class)
MIAESLVPSFGIMGFGGIVAFVIGSIILMDTDVESFQIGIPVIAAITIVSGLFLVITLGIFMKMRGKSVQSGIERMIGDAGVAIDDFDRQGHVKVRSEIWRAFSETPIASGDRVKVVSVDGLHLNVTKENES